MNSIASNRRAGEVGYFSANIKAVDHARVGDTITLASKWQDVTVLPGYAPAKQMVFAGLYPSESDDYEALRDAVGKLKLNDAAFSYMPETSTAMGLWIKKISKILIKLLISHRFCVM